VCYLQGFGNVGAWASEIFQEQGGKVLAVSDAFGAIYNEQGLNVKALRKHIAEGKPLKEFPEGQDPATLLCCRTCTLIWGDRSRSEIII